MLVETSSKFLFGKKSSFRFAGKTPNGENSFYVTARTFLCFEECRSGKITPEDYSESSIEVLEDVDRLKITSLKGNVINANLVNEDYDSIYVDSPDSSVVVEQTAFRDDEKRLLFYSKATVRDGVFTGFSTKTYQEKIIPFGGSTIVIASEGIEFDANYDLIRTVEGRVDAYTPNGDQKTLKGFNIKKYHDGVNLEDMEFVRVGQVERGLSVRRRLELNVIIDSDVDFVDPSLTEEERKSLSDAYRQFQDDVDVLFGQIYDQNKKEWRAMSIEELEKLAEEWHERSDKAEDIIETGTFDEVILARDEYKHSLAMGRAYQEILFNKRDPESYKIYEEEIPED